MSATIAAGTRLGRYEIRSKIGEGGMGEELVTLYLSLVLGAAGSGSGLFALPALNGSFSLAIGSAQTWLRL